MSNKEETISRLKAEIAELKARLADRDQKPAVSSLDAPPNPEEPNIYDLAEFSPFPVIIFDGSGRTIYLNPKLTDILGYSIEDVPDRIVWRKTCYPDPDYRQRVETDTRNWEATSPRKPRRATRKVVAKSGRSLEMEFHARFLPDGRYYVVLIDLTEFNDAIRMTVESEELFRILANHTLDWEYWLDPTGKMRYVSPSCETISGYRPSEFMADPSLFRSLVHPDDKHLLDRHLPVTTDPEKQIEYRIITSEGAVRWIQHLCRPIYAPNGEWLGRRASNRDITQEKEAQEALRVSEARLRMALEATSDGLWDWNLPTNRVYFSPRYFTMLGYEPGELESTFETWENLLHPEDRDRSVRHVKAHIEGHKESFEVAFRLKTKANGWRWILGRGKVVERSPEGAPIRVIGTHVDFTEQKKADEALQISEARLRMALEATQDALWDYDFRTGTAYYSPRYYTMLGYQPDEFKPGLESRHNLIHPDDKAATLAVEQKQLKLGGPVDSVFRLKTRDGQYRWIHSRGRIVEKGPDGELWRLVGVHSDITELKEAQLQLQAAKDELEDRVAIRTEEYHQANQALQKEIQIRHQVQEQIRKSEQRYRQLFTEMTDGFALHEVITDDTGRPVDYLVLEVNPGFERLLGRTAKEVVGQTIRKVLPNVNDKFIERYSEVALTGKSSHFEEYDPELDRYYSVHAFATQAHQFAVVFDDISERKNAEKILEYVVTRY